MAISKSLSSRKRGLKNQSRDSDGAVKFRRVDRFSVHAFSFSCLALPSLWQGPLILIGRLSRRSAAKMDCPFLFCHHGVHPRAGGGQGSHHSERPVVSFVEPSRGIYLKFHRHRRFHCHCEAASAAAISFSVIPAACLGVAQRRRKAGIHFF